MTSYSISPALPTGLSFSTTTGVISGTPTAITATASYMVTATNSGGLTNATVTITIMPPAPTISAPASSFDTTNTSQTIAGTGVVNSTISLTDSGTGSLTVGLIIVNSAGNWSASATLGYGTHSITATQSSNGQTSIASNTVTGIIRPAAPTQLVAIGGVANIILSWAGTGATGYMVLRSTDGGSVYIFIATTTTTSYTDTGLANGTNYCYTVQATNNGEVSPTSVAACATTN